jgi:predicted RNA methylase
MQPQWLAQENANWALSVVDSAGTTRLPLPRWTFCPCTVVCGQDCEVAVKCKSAAASFAETQQYGQVSAAVPCNQLLLISAVHKH